MLRNAVLLLGLLMLCSCSASLDTEMETGRRGADASSAANHSERETSLDLQVHQIIAEQFGVSTSSFSLDASLIKQLGADDLDFVELVLALEEHFSIAIPDEALLSPTEISVPASFKGRDFVEIVRSAVHEG